MGKLMQLLRLNTKSDKMLILPIGSEENRTAKIKQLFNLERSPSEAINSIQQVEESFTSMHQDYKSIYVNLFNDLNSVPVSSTEDEFNDIYNLAVQHAKEIHKFSILEMQLSVDWACKNGLFEDKGEFSNPFIINEKGEFLNKRGKPLKEDIVFSDGFIEHFNKTLEALDTLKQEFYYEWSESSPNNTLSNYIEEFWSKISRLITDNYNEISGLIIIQTAIMKEMSSPEEDISFPEMRYRLDVEPSLEDNNFVSELIALKEINLLNTYKGDHVALNPVLLVIDTMYNMRSLSPKEMQDPTNQQNIALFFQKEIIDLMKETSIGIPAGKKYPELPKLCSYIEQVYTSQVENIELGGANKNISITKGIGPEMDVKRTAKVENEKPESGKYTILLE